MDEQANPSHVEAARDVVPVRRRFLKTLATATGSLLALTAMPRPSRAYSANSPRLHLQDCRIAGSHYYDCHNVLARLRPGDRLSLRRQPDNPHDERAIEVFWRRHKLGYLPRLDNTAAASLADRNHPLAAEITSIDDPAEEWEPVRLRVWVAS